MVLRVLSIVLSSSAIAGGTVSLIGWLTGLPRLTDWDDDGIAMLANASLAAAAAGLSLLLLELSPTDRPERFRWLIRPFAGLTALLGGLTLTQHLFGWNLGIDTFIVDPLWGERAAAAPGRMGPPASTSYMLLGGALLLAASSAGSRARRGATALATIAALPSLVATMAYIYGADPLYSLPSLTGIAHQTAVILLGLAIGVILTIHEFGLGEILRRDDAAGILFRRLFPVGLALLLLTGWAEDYGLKLGLYETDFGNAALTVVRFVMLSALLWWTARAVIHQIERRNLAESALRESESKLAALIETLPIGVGVADSAGNTSSLNPAGLEIHGFDSLDERLVELEDYRTLFELRDPDGSIVPVSDWPLARAIRGDFVTDYEVGFRRLPGGDVRLVSYTVVPIVDDTGSARNVVFVMQDITNRKRAERALRDSEEFNRAVIESSSDCIKLLDLDGNLLYMNPSGLAMMEIDDFESVRGGHWAGFWSEEARPTVEDAVRRALDGDVGRFRAYCDTAKGRSKYWDVMVTTVPGSDGRPLQLLAVSREMTEVKRIEEALRDSEQRFRTLADNISQFAWMADEKGWIFWYNQRWYDYTGTTFEEMEGWGWKSVHHPDHLDRVVERIQHSWDTGEIWEDIFPLRGKDGIYRWFLSRALPIRDENGSVVRWFGTNTDVTEARNVEQALRASEERVRMAVESADVGTWDFNLAAGELLWSERCKAIFGLGPDEKVDYTVFRERLHPEDRESVDHEVQATFDPRGTGRFDRDYRVLWPNGTIRWVAARGQTYFEGDGPQRLAVRMMGTVLDLTERKQSEARLTDEVATTEALRRIGILLAAELDMDKLVQAVTDVATRLTEAEFGAFFYNAEGEEGEGDSYMLYTVSGVPKELFEQFPMPRNTLIFDPTFRGQGSVRLDDVTKDSRYGKNPPHHGMPKGHLPVRSYLSVSVVSRSGEVLGGLFFGHSEVAVFTERHQHLAEGIAAQAAVAIDNAALYRKAQTQTEQLREADQRKDEFLATLAHELRNPLAAIRTAASLLERTQDHPEHFAEMTGVLNRQTGHLVHLIDDLLDVSRITRGKIQLRKERTALADVLRQAVDTCGPMTERQEQTIDVRLPEETITLEGDPVRLAQIFGNLINNASKYSDPRAAIRVHAERVGEGRAVAVAVTVEDDGIGIPQGELTTIFGMFSQVDAGLYRSRGGLGIGLTLVKRLVELHGGRVSAHSEGPGRGSRFVVRLPLAAAKTRVESTDSDETTKSSSKPKRKPSPSVGVSVGRATGRRVLVVDDNVDAARTLALLLRTVGCDTRTAHEGDEAVAEAERFRPDVILLDIGMPGMSGYQVCETLREKPWGAGIVIVAVTGWGQEDVRRRSVAAGFDAHLVKPVQPSMLLDLLDELAKARQPST